MVNEFSAEYFNARDTLECGQIFRFKPYKKGYFVISTDKACYIYTEDNKTFVYTAHGTKQEVELGKSNDNQVVVNRGLKANDKILLVPPENANKLSLKTLD